jgi:hypothetical protein
VSDEELFSLYRVADIIWCCFTPVRDLSSGVFGRAMQFGRPAIVRTGSHLATLQEDIGSGISIPWGAPDEAAALLLDANFESRAPISRHAEVADALRMLIHDHQGKVGPACAA